MRARKNHYKEMERSATLVLVADFALFIFFLIAAAKKSIASVLSI